MKLPIHYSGRRVALMGICSLAAMLPFYAAGAQEENGFTVNGVLANEMQNAKLSMLFDGETAEDCRLWQAKFRKKINQLLGDSKPHRVISRIKITTS